MINLHNRAAEESIIACLITSFNECKESFYMLKSCYFEEDICTELFKSIQKCVEDKKQIDVVTILQNISVGEDVKNKIIHMVNILPSILHHKEYATIVRENYVKRQLFDKLNQSINDIEYVSSIETVSGVKQIVDKSMELLTNDSESNFASLKKEFIYNLRNDKTEDIVYTGWQNFDNGFGGFTKGEVIAIAGRPGMGKTTFALNLVTKLRKQGYRILFDSLEMTEQQILNKLVSIELRIKSNDIRYKNLSEANIIQIENLLNNYSNLEVITNAYTVSKLMEKAQQYAPDIIVIDYLQYMKPEDKHPNRAAEIGYISRAIKFMAKELGVVIILLSQLSREMEKRSIKLPMLSDLRDSGEIEQDVAGCLFVQRDALFDSDADPQDTKIIVAKNRFGKSNTIYPFRFELETQSFYETQVFDYEPPF